MIVIDFTLRDIRELCGETFYKRGKSYYESRRVSKLTFDDINNRYTAQVKGSLAYRVQIDIDSAGDIEPWCACPAFESYNSCKHVAATLIAIHRLQTTAEPKVSKLNIAEPNVTPSKHPDLSNYKLADQFISSFHESAFRRESNDGISDNAEQLQFEFTLKVQSTYRNTGFSLEMRVGVKRLYVVAKLSQFLEHLEQRIFESPEYFLILV